MFRIPQPRRVLFLAGDRRPVLARILAAAWPEAQVEASGPAATEWLGRLQDPSVEVVAALTDSLSAADLHTLHAALCQRPELRGLLFAGGRGLAGAEALLDLPRMAILPEPWTLAGLERLLDAPPPAPPDPADLPPAPAARRAGTPLPPEEQAVPASIRSLAAGLKRVEEHLAGESARKSEQIQAQALELARLRESRRQEDRDRAREEVLHGLFMHRDRLAGLLADTRDEAAGRGMAAVLRSLDEYLATLGILADKDPDPADALLCRVVGTRPRTPGDPPAGVIVRKPAFYRMCAGQRRILRPAEIETLTCPAPGDLH